MKLNSEGVVTALVVASAIAVATANVHREFYRAPLPARAANTPPTYVKDWTNVLKSGTIIGDTAAPVKIIEFADLECPGCRMFYNKTQELPPALRAKVALVFVHFPLPMHRFATLAARAAECARAEHRFGSVVDALFKAQDSLGLKSWGTYGRDAGMSDTAQFARCTTSPGSMPLIDAGRSIGKTLGVNATPTILINGWRYSSPPYDSLATLVGHFAAVR